MTDNKDPNAIIGFDPDSVNTAEPADTDNDNTITNDDFDDDMPSVAVSDDIVDEDTQKAIDDENVSDSADDIPSANASGREGGHKKKLQLAALGVVGMIVALVGAGASISQYQESAEEERVAEAEAAAREQKGMANGQAIDISGEMEAMTLPPPAALEEGGEFTADNGVSSPQSQPLPEPANTAYEPPASSSTPYVPVANSARESSSSNDSGWTAGIDYTPPAAIPASPAPVVDTIGIANSEPPPPTVIEYTQPQIKGSGSSVLVDTSAIRRVSATINENHQTQSGSKVGGNLSPTRLSSSVAQRRGDTSMMLLRGASIPCVLETKIVSTYQGFTTCRISRDVYSNNGKTILLERGTRVFGEQNVQIQQGQARVAVLWTRAETPKGVSINLDSPATGQLGEMGVDAKVNNHFWKRFGGAIMLSMIQDALDVGKSKLEDKNGGGNNNTTVENTSNTASSMAEQALNNTINIAPTATINQGTIINIMVARDMDFSDVYSLKKKR